MFHSALTILQVLKGEGFSVVKLRMFYLDEWTLNEIKKELGGKLKGLLAGPHVDCETLDRSLIQKYQLQKLRHVVSYVAEKSPFYRKLFAENGIKDLLIENLDDLKRLPFTEPDDIAKNAYQFLCVPVGEIKRIVTTISTSGTSGTKKRVFFTVKDIENILNVLSVNTKIVLKDDKAMVQVMLPGRTVYGQSDILARALRKLGHNVIITGPLPDADAQVKLIKDNNATALVGYSFYLNRLTRSVMQRYNLAELKVRNIVATGEPLPRSVRKLLEDCWGAKVYSHYGLTEAGYNVGMECDTGSGYHVYENDYIIEVVNPCTGEEVKEGDEGELVITTLRREGMPLIRYRTGDITKVVPETCECGSVLKKIGPVTRKSSRQFKWGSIRLDLVMLDEVLFSYPDVLDFRVVVEINEKCLTATVWVETCNEKGLARRTLEIEEQIRMVLFEGKMFCPLEQLEVKLCLAPRPMYDVSSKRKSFIVVGPVKDNKQNFLDKC